MHKRAAVTVAFVVATTGLLSAAPASASVTFQMPFPCGQAWDGQTRTNHNPLPAIDLNRTDDANDVVVASASGTVQTVRDLGDTSYGRYIVVDHGGGWTSLYAHLASQAVSVGDHVSSGERLGTVGMTGTSSPHLHFEQAYNGTPQRVTFDGTQALYYGTRSYTSRNDCGGGSPRNGICETGEFCYYYNSGNAGSVSDFNGSLADYGNSLPSCYVFKGPGAGQDQCIKNNAASVWNRSSTTVRVYFNTGFDGSYQNIGSGYKGDLNSTLKNENASHRFL